MFRCRRRCGCSRCSCSRCSCSRCSCSRCSRCSRRRCIIAGWVCREGDVVFVFDDFPERGIFIKIDENLSHVTVHCNEGWAVVVSDSGEMVKEFTVREVAMGCGKPAAVSLGVGGDEDACGI